MKGRCGKEFLEYAEVCKMFRTEYASLYVNEVDYWAAQLAWSTFLDCLCKDGMITQYAWDNWSTPFPYGKHLVPSKNNSEQKRLMMEREVMMG